MELTAVLHERLTKLAEEVQRAYPPPQVGRGLVVAAGVPRWRRADAGGGPADRACRDRAAARQAQPVTRPSATSDRTDLPAVAVLSADGATTAVALVLSGGQRAAASRRPSPRSSAAVRMRPFASLLHRRGRAHGLAVWTVRYRYRGWNGDQRSPVVDTAVGARGGPAAPWRRTGGGRRALDGWPDRARGRRRSVRCAASARSRHGRSAPIRSSSWPASTVLIAHGSLDMVTSPQASRDYADAGRRGALGSATSWSAVTCTRCCSAGGAGTGSRPGSRWERWESRPCRGESSKRSTPKSKGANYQGLPQFVRFRAIPRVQKPVCAGLRTP